MNIFFLSWLIKNCATWHFDKHMKMILETAQLLSTAHHALNPGNAQAWQEKGYIYRKTHVGHPCALWASAHRNNYLWLARLGLALCKEYTRRYSPAIDNNDGNATNGTNGKEKIHKTEKILRFLRAHIPKRIATFEIVKHPDNPKRFTLPIPQSMDISPESKRDECLVTCGSCKKTTKSLPFVHSQELVKDQRIKNNGEQEGDGNHSVSCWKVVYTCLKCQVKQAVFIPQDNARKAVMAYRAFYQSKHKRHLDGWRRSQPPPWWK